MNDKKLTHNDFLQRLDIRDVLLDAGYRQNRRFGLRLSSFIRTDSEEKRIRGDKFVITQQGKCCCQPPRQKEYNVVSFIKEHPQLFAEYSAGMAPDRLVNLVCNRLLNHPIENREARIIRPARDIRPFDIGNYDLHRFDPQDRATQKKFYPYFKSRGIDLYTQYAFHRNFCLATKKRDDGLRYTNLAFPMTLPKDPEKTVGFEERGRARADGSSGYKGKAEGSNSSEGLWIASPAGMPLSEAKHVYWFESAYDAMAYYQLHQAQNKELRKAVFVSTGGNPTATQMRGVLAVTRPAEQHICFDTDLAGMDFTRNLIHAMYRTVRASIEETPERKPYLDSIPDRDDLDGGNIGLLPEALQKSCERSEAEHEKALSMRMDNRHSPAEIRKQEEIARKCYVEFREGLREFLAARATSPLPASSPNIPTRTGTRCFWRRSPGRNRPARRRLKRKRTKRNGRRAGVGNDGRNP